MRLVFKKEYGGTVPGIRFQNEDAEFICEMKSLNQVHSKKWVKEHGTVVSQVQVHQVSSISSEGKSRTGSPQFLHTQHQMVGGVPSCHCSVFVCCQRVLLFWIMRNRNQVLTHDRLGLYH